MNAITRSVSHIVESAPHVPQSRAKGVPPLVASLRIEEIHEHRANGETKLSRQTERRSSLSPQKGQLDVLSRAQDSPPQTLRVAAKLSHRRLCDLGGPAQQARGVLAQQGAALHTATRIH